MTPLAREGLAWDDSGLNSSPIWTREPNPQDIAHVSRRTLHVKCEVSFFAEGAFNKLYLVQTAQRDLLMRVSLPVHPHAKTRGEVTTLRFLRRRTEVPVPDVVAFDDSNDNEIGFEWILMERMPGVSAYKRWRTMTTFQKVALVQSIAELQAQIFRHEFSRIGTLMAGSDESSHAETPGEMVSNMFFWSDHFDYNIARGPYRSAHDWLAAYLEFAVKDQVAEHENAQDEDDEKDAKFALGLSERLINLLPRIFPPIQYPPERTVIWHDDLSLSNILVDEDGNITALIDWECVSAMPRWVATKLPRFLEGPNREREPKREEYADESVGQSEASGADEGDQLDNEGKNELYWIHLLEYETTQLRKVYRKRMRELQPEWEAIRNENGLKDDFFAAVTRTANGYHLKGISRWVNIIDTGEFPRLIF